MIYLLSLVLLTGALLLYFRLAVHLRIIDKPNQRSSHKSFTIRGAGVIFPLAMLIAGLAYPNYLWPVLGVLVVGAISFWDDYTTLSMRWRLMAQLVAVGILFFFLDTLSLLPVWANISLFILGVGIINAYNFMDGINGMTGLYTIVVLGCLQYINLYSIPFCEPDLIWLPIIASLIFLFFNYRRKAICFAGDVGSISVAFWVVFLLFSLIVKAHNPIYILLLTVYGVDSVMTIAHRLLRKENIFLAHRLHLFQLLANERGLPQRLVSLVYALVQLVLSVVLLYLIKVDTPSLVILLIILVPPGVFYLLVKPGLMRLRKEKLARKQQLLESEESCEGHSFGVKSPLN